MTMNCGMVILLSSLYRRMEKPQIDECEDKKEARRPHCEYRRALLSPAKLLYYAVSPFCQ